MLLYSKSSLFIVLLYGFISYFNNEIAFIFISLRTCTIFCLICPPDLCVVCGIWGLNLQIVFALSGSSIFERRILVPLTEDITRLSILGAKNWKLPAAEVNSLQLEEFSLFCPFPVYSSCYQTPSSGFRALLPLFLYRINPPVPISYMGSRNAALGRGPRSKNLHMLWVSSVSMLSLFSIKTCRV